MAEAVAKRRGPKTKAQKAAEAALVAGREPGPSPMGDNSEQFARAMPIPTRAATRQQAREPSRDMSREPIRADNVVVGRNGEVLSRTRAGAGSTDPMEIHATDIPIGWKYQWNTVSIYNEPQYGTQSDMDANGWRAVPASRHPGRWVSADHGDASIIIGGLRLEERPIELDNEAKAEELAKARAQMRDQNAIMTAMGKGGPVPDGMSMDSKQYRGVAPQIRTNYAPEGEAPRAGYQRE